MRDFAVPIFKSDLEPGGYYWARRFGEDELQIVQISTVFGRDLEHLTVAVMSSDQHHALSEFEYRAVVHPPEQ